MAISCFLTYWGEAQDADAVFEAYLAGPASFLAETPEALSVELYASATATDPLLGGEAPPLLVAQLRFATLALAERALGGAALFRALDEFQDFLSLYPTHPRAPYAQYKVGMVHYSQMRNPERDQQETLNAIQEFEAFMERYPTAQELIPEVEQRLRESRNRLSEHNFTVGRFYYRFKTYAGAISRFRQILDEDPNYTARDEVYYYLAESLAAVRNEAEALPYFARILEEFDSSEYAEPAKARIAELEALQEQ